MASKQVYNKIFDKDKWDKVNQETKNIITDFIQEMKSQKKATGTVEQYYNDLRIIAIYIYDNLDNKSLMDLKKRDFRNLVLYADETWHMSNARINRIMSAVRMICSFLEDDEDDYEEYDRSAAAKIKGLPKDPVREIMFIPNDVIEQLYQKLMNEKRYKEATLLGILYDSGVRKNEVLQIERASITQEGNSTNKVRGKRGKIFPVLYFKHTKDAFKLYNAQREDNNPMLFITSTGRPADAGTLYEWVTEWADDLEDITGEDYSGINVHTFRHCYIEHMCDGTHWLCKELGLGKVPIERVKTLAHHSDVSTTDGYRSNDEERDIEELLGIKLD